MSKTVYKLEQRENSFSITRDGKSISYNLKRAIELGLKTDIEFALKNFSENFDSSKVYKTKKNRNLSLDDIVIWYIKERIHQREESEKGREQMYLDIDEQVRTSLRLSGYKPEKSRKGNLKHYINRVKSLFSRPVWLSNAIKEHDKEIQKAITKCLDQDGINTKDLKTPKKFISGGLEFTESDHVDKP